MNDVIVSIRMPKNLASDLKKLSEKLHFLDLSEEIRSIIREKYFENTGVLRNDNK